MAVDIFDRLSQALLPHREALQSTIENYLCEIRDELIKGNAKEGTGRATMFDKWSTRPFENTGAGGRVEVIRSKLNEAFLIQTLWFQAKREKTEEGLPAFMLTINGIPTWVLTPGRVLTNEEWGVYSEKLSGDLVVPRGSVLEIEPLFPTEKKLEIKGAITFTREVLPGTQDATGGTSEEQYGIWPSRQYEPDRFIPDMEGVDSRWQGPDAPGSDTINEEYGGNISPDPIIASDMDATPPQVS